jgi:hypothetical protein
MRAVIALRRRPIGADAEQIGGIGTALGSGMPRPGTDGRFSAGGDTKLESPDANNGVTGSGVEMPATVPAAVPGIGGPVSGVL